MKKINFVFDWIGPCGPIPNNLSPTIVDLSKAMGYYQHETDRNLITGQSSAAYDLLHNHTQQARTFSTSHLPDDKFLYEYNHYWWDSAEEFFNSGKLNGFLHASNRPQVIIDRIKQRSAFLLVTIPLESPLHDHQLFKIDKYFCDSGLPPEQIIYVTCSPNGTEVYKDFCHRHNKEPLNLNFDYLPFYFSIYKKQFQGKIKKYSTNSKEKTFLMFNRRWGNHPQRVLMLCYLHKNNLLDNFYISFSKNEIDNNGTFTDHAKRFFNRLSSSNSITDNDLESIEKQLPLILDCTDLKQGLMFNEFNTTKKFYENSMISIVAETYFFGNIIHLTEKSYKPIAYKHPFIMFATAGSLKALKDQGFKTFESLWDESYDEEKDDTKRFFKILELIKSISSLSPEEKQRIINSCESIVDYNYQHLQNGDNIIVNQFVEKYGS